MDIALKYKIVEKIIQSDDEVLLNEINSLVGLSETDFWTAVPPTIKQAIEKAKQELDRGEGISHSQVIDDVKRRYLKK